MGGTGWGALSPLTTCIRWRVQGADNPGAYIFVFANASCLGFYLEFVSVCFLFVSEKQFGKCP